jgi:hypothetical protein
MARGPQRNCWPLQAVALLAAAFFGLLAPPSHAEQTENEDEKPVVICSGSPEMKKYRVVFGQAELVAAALQDFKGPRLTFVKAEGKDAVLVFGTPNDQREIAKYIEPYRNDTK